MSNTFKHVEEAKNRRSKKASDRVRWHPTIDNQYPPETHAQHHSDLRFACHCYECLAAMRGATGNRKLRRIRHGERRSIRVALATNPLRIDLTRRVRVIPLS